MKKYRKISLISVIFILIIAGMITAGEITTFDEFDSNLSSLHFKYILNSTNNISNSSYIYIPPGKCIEASTMQLRGENISGGNDTFFDVVLATDLSDSMLDCLSELKYFTTEKEDIKTKNCYAFKDDFDLGDTESKWTKHRGTWSIIEDSSNKVLKQTSIQKHVEQPLIEINKLQFKNFEMDFDFKLLNDNTEERWFQANFGRKQKYKFNNFLYTGQYSIRYYLNTGCLDLLINNNTIERTIAQNCSTNILINDYNRFKVIFNYSNISNSSYIKVYSNDIEAISFYQFNNSFDSHEKGLIGFSSENTGFYIDNVYIKSLDHDYNCTEDYGYATVINSTDSYLYENVSIPQDECIEWEVLDGPCNSSDELCSEICKGPYLKNASNCSDLHICTGPIYDPIIYACDKLFGDPTRPDCCSYDSSYELNLTDPNSCCYGANSCFLNQELYTNYHSSCTPEEFDNNNLYYCWTDSYYLWWDVFCITNSMFRVGTCADNVFSTGNVYCNSRDGIPGEEGQCADADEISQRMAAGTEDMCLEKENDLVGYDYEVNEDGIFKNVLINHTFDSGSLEGWEANDYQISNDGGVLKLFDTSGRVGYAKIFDTENDGFAIFSKYVNNLEFDYKCEDGVRFGILLRTDDGVYLRDGTEPDTYEWNRRQHSCLSGNNNINCMTTFNDPLYRYRSLGKLNPTIECNDTWNHVNVNLSDIMTDRRIVQILLGDWDAYNMSNSNKVLYIDNFKVGTNYTIPGGFFTHQCGGIPQIIESQLGNEIVICDGNCSNASVEKCTIQTHDIGSCDPASFVNSNNSVCFQKTTEGGVWREIYRHMRIYDSKPTWSDCPKITYKWMHKRPVAIRPTYQYCPVENVTKKVCKTFEENVSNRNLHHNTDFNESLKISNYVRSPGTYYSYVDGISGNNDWECEGCARFYEEEFFLEKDVAYGKTFTDVNNGCTDNNFYMGNNFGTYDTYGTYHQYFQCYYDKEVSIDLEKVYNISRIKIWHFYIDSQSYRRGYAFELWASNNSDFSDSVKIYDVLNENQGLQLDHSGGHEIPLNVSARYIKLKGKGYYWEKNRWFNNWDILVAQFEVFTPMKKEDLVNANLLLNRESGVECFLNSQKIVDTSDNKAVNYLVFNEDYEIPVEVFKEGKNILSCSTKGTDSYKGINVKLILNERNTIISTAPDFDFVQQQNLCSTDSYTGYAYDPLHHTCEYAKKIEECYDYYPLNVTKNLNLTVSGWSLDTDNFKSFKEVIEYFANMIGAKIEIVNSSNGFGDINDSIWDSDIIFFDSDNENIPGSIINDIENHFENKTIVTDINTYTEIIDHSTLSIVKFRETDSYGHGSIGYNLTDGISLGKIGIEKFSSTDSLAELWTDKVQDTHERAANFLDLFFPLWYEGNITQMPEIPKKYCIQGKATFEICPAEKHKLAKSNNRMFINMTVGTYSEGVRVGLVGFGSDADVCGNYTEITNETDVLNSEINSYISNCGATCISCAINRSVYLLNHTDDIEDNIVLMTDGLANRVIGNSADSNVNGAIEEAIDFACNESNPDSAKARGIKIHTIYYGNNKTNDGKKAISLMENISNCTFGQFGSADEVEELKEIYKKIIAGLGTGYPKPLIRFGGNNSQEYDYISEKRIINTKLWQNRTCTGAKCNSLINSINREIIKCRNINTLDYYTNGCNITVNVTSLRSGKLYLENLKLGLTNAIESVVAFPFKLPSYYKTQICPMEVDFCGDGYYDGINEECENNSHCPYGACISPGRPSACTCIGNSTEEPNVCGNGVLESANSETCEFNLTSRSWPSDCYQSGSKHECRKINFIVERCGNGKFNVGEECDQDSDCNGLSFCIPAGVKDSCSCVNSDSDKNKSVIKYIDLAAGTYSLDLTDFASAPNNIRERLNWTIIDINDSGFGFFYMTDSDINGYTESFHYKPSFKKGSFKVILQVNDSISNSVSNLSIIFKIEVNYEDKNVNSDFIISKSRIISDFYEDETGEVVSWGPYKLSILIVPKSD